MGTKMKFDTIIKNELELSEDDVFIISEVDDETCDLNETKETKETRAWFLNKGVEEGNGEFRFKPIWKSFKKLGKDIILCSGFDMNILRYNELSLISIDGYEVFAEVRLGIGSFTFDVRLLESVEPLEVTEWSIDVGDIVGLDTSEYHGISFYEDKLEIGDYEFSKEQAIMIFENLADWLDCDYEFPD